MSQDVRIHFHFGLIRYTWRSKLNGSQARQFQMLLCLGLYFRAIADGKDISNDGWGCQRNQLRIRL